MLDIEFRGKYFTTKEAAEYLGISESTLRRRLSHDTRYGRENLYLRSKLDAIKSESVNHSLSLPDPDFASLPQFS